MLAKYFRRTLPRMAFSSSGKQPVEHTINEKEFEAQIHKARDTIAEKLKLIKAQQEREEQTGDHHVHNPKDFQFVNRSKINEVYSGVYFYNKRSNLQENGLIYKTNREVYQTAEYVDSICSVTAVYCGYKGIRNLLVLMGGLPWTPVFAAGWLFLAYI
jgi:hypothetical protein